MIDVPGARLGIRKGQVEPIQQFVVCSGMGPPLLDPLFQMGKFCAEDRCLQRVETLTEADILMFIF